MVSISSGQSLLFRSKLGIYMDRNYMRSRILWFTHTVCIKVYDRPQWCNRLGGRWQSAPSLRLLTGPPRLLTGKFLLTYREKRDEEKMEEGWKLRRKEWKLEKGRWKIEIESWGFVLGLPKWKFSTRKKLFMQEKRSGQMTLPPQKIFSVMPLIGLFPIKLSSDARGPIASKICPLETRN